MSQLISNLAVGARIKYGKYQVENSSVLPIIWKVIDKNHAGYPSNSVTLLTDEIIDQRGIDAKEPSNADPGRASKGSGRYRTSNLRQWLNSNGAANAWWVAQNLSDGTLNTNNHDATPDDAGMSQPTGYDDIKGFLANFTASELSEILDTTLDVTKNVVTDGGSYETVTDKVFLLSNTEVGFPNQNGIAEGTLFSIFDSNESRTALMTPQLYSDGLSSQYPGSILVPWQWWLRTSYTSNSYQTRLVLTDGSMDFYSAYYGQFGVRPAVNLSSDILVSDNVDSDGCYVVDANISAESTVNISGAANVTVDSTVIVLNGINTLVESKINILSELETLATSTVNIKTPVLPTKVSSTVNVNFLWVPVLYVFSTKEQLQTILVNSGKACPFYNAIHNELINRENTFTFEIPADHADSKYVIEGCLISFQDLDSNWQLFEVKRVIDIDDTNATKQIYCVHTFYELLGDIVPSGNGTSVRGAIISALSQSRWEVGLVADLALTPIAFSYQTALECLQEVAKNCKGELKFRVVLYKNKIVHRYVDLVTQRGSNTGKQFIFGKDLEKVEREIDFTGLCTAMYGQGKTTASGDRLNFAAINAGKTFISDDAALAQYGLADGTRHRFGVFEDGQETDATSLMAKTQSFLDSVKAPLATYTFQVMLLEQLSPDYSHEAVRIGDIVATIDDNFVPSLELSERVIQIQWNLLEYDKTVITLGSFLKDLTDVEVAQQQVNQQVNQQMLDQTTEMQDITVFNHLLNSRADEGFASWMQEGTGFTIDPLSGFSGGASFKCTGAFGVSNKLTQRVYGVSHRNSYTISAAIATEGTITKGTTMAEPLAGIKVIIHYDDGTSETKYLSMEEAVYEAPIV